MINKKTHKIRIKMQAFDTETLNACCQKIILSVEQNNSMIKGPIPIPTKKKNLLCVKITSCKQRFKRTF